MSEDLRATIADAVLRIDQADSAAPIKSTDTDILAGSGTLQIGRSTEGYLMAFVPAGPDTHGATGRAGITLERQDLQDSSGGMTPFLVMTCHRPDLEEAFIDLVAAMAESFVRTPGAASETMFRLFVRWRELFAEVTGHRLSRASVAGLLAELLVLSQLSERIGPEALALWQGPDAARHDYLDSRHALEVKATTRGSLDSVTISGIDQLEAPAGGTLHLATFRLEFGADGPSVETVFDQLVSSGIPSLDLRERIRSIGLDLGSSDSAATWGVAEQRLYLVDEGFPRLIRSSFRQGHFSQRITAVRYQISTAGLPALADADVGSAWTEAIEGSS